VRRHSCGCHRHCMGCQRTCGRRGWLLNTCLVCSACSKWLRLEGAPWQLVTLLEVEACVPLHLVAAAGYATDIMAIR
jgi:hypothetical protein